MENRIGMTNIATNGMKITIIAYRKANDIDVQFEDGLIIRNKRYESFLKGKIGRKNIKRKIKGKADRLHERRQNTMGLWMEIVEYRNADDIDIKFEDGTILTHRVYSNFVNGQVHHPKCDDALSQKSKWLGKVGIINKTGEKMTIVAYKNAKDITVDFDSTKTRKKTSIAQFTAGSVSNPDFQLHVGEEKISSSGMKMTIAKKVGPDQYIIKFENGYITDHPYHYSSFASGYVPNPTTENPRIGAVKRMRNGLLAKVVGIQDSTDVEILFEDGVTVKHQMLYTFSNAAAIPHPDITGTGKHKYHGYLIQKALCFPNNISLYYCKDKDGITSIMTLQELLDKEGVKKMHF